MNAIFCQLEQMFIEALDAYKHVAAFGPKKDGVVKSK